MPGGVQQGLLSSQVLLNIFSNDLEGGADIILMTFANNTKLARSVTEDREVAQKAQQQLGI